VKANTKITYDLTNFPSLPARKSPQMDKKEVATSSKTSTTPKDDTPSPTIMEMMTRITALENNFKEQKDQINQIHQTLSAQLQAIDRLTTVLEQQEQNTHQMQEAILKLTKTVNNLEQIVTKLYETSSTTKPSPDHEKPGKRLKFRTEDTRTNICHINDDPMEDTEHWESQSPNVHQHNRRSPSPSL